MKKQTRKEMKQLISFLLLLFFSVVRRTAASSHSQQLQINEHFAVSGFLREAGDPENWAEKCVLLLLDRDRQHHEEKEGGGSTFVQLANDSYFLLFPEPDLTDTQAWLFVYDATCGDPLLRVVVQLEERFTRLDIDLPVSREFECFSALNPCETRGQVLPHHLWPPGSSPLLLAHQANSEPGEEDRDLSGFEQQDFLLEPADAASQNHHDDERSKQSLVIVDGVAAAVLISFLVVLHLVNCCTYACIFSRPAQQSTDVDCTAVSLPSAPEDKRRRARAYSRDQMWELLTHDQGHLGLRR